MKEIRGGKRGKLDRVEKIKRKKRQGATKKSHEQVEKGEEKF